MTPRERYYAADRLIGMVCNKEYRKACDTLQTMDFSSIDPMGVGQGTAQATLHDLDIYKDNLPPAMQGRFALLMCILHELRDMSYNEIKETHCRYHV